MLSFLAKILFKVNQDITSWDLVFVRGIVSIIFVYFNVASKNVNLTNFKGQGLVLAIGVILGFLCYWFGLLSYQYISVTKATLIIYTNPIIVIVLAFLFLKENITRYDLISVVLVICG
mmetsp:Transcript_30351/g.34761  ORF Transcript_30351/g.34761 Transcript_30351/m.34761 type:complete len:118 (+) Transcript_30351:35-388(+)